MKKISIVTLICLTAMVAVNVANAASNSTTVYFFYGQTCPHCFKEKPFLVSLEQKYSDLTVEYKEVYNDKDNHNLFSALSRAYGTEPRGVPAVFIGDFSPIIGYRDDQTTGKDIENKIKHCLDDGCIDPITKLNPVTAPNLDADQVELQPAAKIEPSQIDKIAVAVNDSVQSAVQANQIGIEVGEQGLEEGIHFMGGNPVQIKTGSQPVKLIKTSQAEIGKTEIYKYFSAGLKQDAENAIEIKSVSNIFLEDEELRIKNEEAQILTIKNKPEEVVEAINSISEDISITEMVLEIEEEKPIYTVSVKQPVKLFGFISFKAKTEVKVSAENNQVISAKKPWWGFLATGFSKFISL